MNKTKVTVSVKIEGALAVFIRRAIRHDESIASFCLEALRAEASARLGESAPTAERGMTKAQLLQRIRELESK
jgi:hypothetical protein